MSRSEACHSGRGISLKSQLALPPESLPGHAPLMNHPSRCGARVALILTAPPILRGTRAKRDEIVPQLRPNMRTNLSAIAVVCVLAAGGVPVPAQVPEPPRLGLISITPEGRPWLALEGSIATAFRSYFDLFRLESSFDLVRWEPLATVLRTNAATNAPRFLDESAAGSSHRFYRTAADTIRTPFLPPSGPHSVGTFSRVLTDASRTNRFGIRANSSFVATFWYAAQPAPGAAPAAYMDRPLATHRPYWGAYTNRVPDFVQMASLDAPVAATPSRFPVIIYTHGLGTAEGRGVRTENTEKILELTSHGFIVLAVDHTDAYGLVLPPDRLIVGGNAFSFSFLNDRLKDIEFLLNYLEQLNAGDPAFRDRLDLDRIGIMGWSFGGGTAAEACRVQDRLKAAVLLDGYLGSMPTLLNRGLAKPLLTMLSPSSGLAADNTTLFNRSTHTAYQLSIRDASHEAFTDNAWIIGPSAATRRRAQAMNACLISFFNKHLKGMEDSLIDNPAVTHTDVISFRKK